MLNKHALKRSPSLKQPLTNQLGESQMKSVCFEEYVTVRSAQMYEPSTKGKFSRFIAESCVTFNGINAQFQIAIKTYNGKKNTLTSNIPEKLFWDAQREESHPVTS